MNKAIKCICIWLKFNIWFRLKYLQKSQWWVLQLLMQFRLGVTHAIKNGNIHHCHPFCFFHFISRCDYSEKSTFIFLFDPGELSIEFLKLLKKYKGKIKNIDMNHHINNFSVPNIDSRLDQTNSQTSRTLENLCQCQWQNLLL